MKYLLLVVVFFIVIDLPAQNGNANVPSGKNVENKSASSSIESKVKSNTGKLVKSLKLNEIQEKSLKDALMDYEINLAKIEKSKNTNQEKYKKITLLNKTRQNRLKAIFSKEQYKAYTLSFP